MLCAVGGLDIAAMAGAFWAVPMSANRQRWTASSPLWPHCVPVTLCPEVQDYLFLSRLLWVGLPPGSRPAGSGALPCIWECGWVRAAGVLLFRVLEGACGVMARMATFAQAAIQDDYLDEIRAGDSFTVDKPCEDTADRRRKKRKEHHGFACLAAALSGTHLGIISTMTPMTTRTQHVSRRHVAIGQAWILLPSSAASICPPPYRHWTGTARCCSTASLPVCRADVPFSAPDAGAANRVLRELLDISRYSTIYRCVRRYHWHGGEDYRDWTEVYVQPGGYLSRAGSGI